MRQVIPSLTGVTLYQLAGVGATLLLLLKQTFHGKDFTEMIDNGWEESDPVGGGSLSRPAWRLLGTLFSPLATDWLGGLQQIQSSLVASRPKVLGLCHDVCPLTVLQVILNSFQNMLNLPLTLRFR